MVKLNKDKYINSDGFTSASRRKRANRKKVTVGDSAGVSTIKGVAKKAVVCVNRLDLGTTVEDVEPRLRANNVSVISNGGLTMMPMMPWHGAPAEGGPPSSSW